MDAAAAAAAGTAAKGDVLLGASWLPLRHPFSQFFPAAPFVQNEDDALKSL